MDRPNDRLASLNASEGDETDPKIYVVVNNQKFMRPGLETYYAKPDEGGKSASSGCACNPVTGVYCSCNKVCTCNPQCSCESHRSCSCNSHSRGGGGGRYCSCVPVH